MEYRKGDQILAIEQHASPASPREWDNMGTMICLRTKYELGDKHDYDFSSFYGWDEIRQHLMIQEKGAVILPLYLYDHSGLRMKVGSFAGLLPQGHARFDSGQVGFIYAAKNALKDWPQEHRDKNYPGLTDEQILERILTAEVETYDQFLRGDIYGFTLYTVKTCDLGHEHREATDSCWGFYGTDWKANGLLEHVGIEDLDGWEEKET